MINHIKENLFDCGHTACLGCGEALAAKRVLQVAGKDVITTDATGCLEVFTTRYPQSSWGVPFIHSLFENSAAVASGIETALKALGKQDTTKVIAQGGDGGTADIGLQALSGMFERGHDVLYVCYDNEAYMNTGVQRSGLTPFDCMTATTPAGKVSWGNQNRKKDVPAIAIAHGIPYVATSSVAFPRDIENKVKKALSITGPKYIQIHVPCPLGWKSKPAETIKVAALAVQTGLYPIYEVEDGDMISKRRIFETVPVEEYLKLQGRFAHLFKGDEGKNEIAKIQRIADENIKKFILS